jgi:hypothetical protein
LQWFERQLNEENLLTDVPHWVFVEWAETDKKGQVTALNAQFVAALRVAAELARLADHSRAATRYQDLAQRGCEAINTLLWDEVRGVYADARRHGKLSRRLSQQSNAAVMAFDVAPRERWARMWEIILDEKRLVLTHALGHDGEVTPFDEEYNVVQVQPFYSHFLHRALRKDNKSDVIAENIRARWSAMLADGESTFRETWQLEPITSKCHAWSATPTFDLSTDGLGVSPIESGFKRLSIAPQVMGLQWVRGKFPTPKGEVSVDWKHDADRFELNVTVPPECEAEIVCPLAKGWGAVDGVTVSGKVVIAREGDHQLIS